MLIFGDNLPALKGLTSNPSIKGRVKLVYIDPPFSTDQDFRGGNSRVSTISSSVEDQIAYKDTIIGAEYLEFLRKRLIFLKELLANDGSIYVHIDWKKGHYVKVLMDEIFGEEHFINDIARIKCNPKNFARPAYGNVKDMILFYSKSGSYVWNEAKEDMTEDDVQRLFPKVDKDGRGYTTIPLHAPGETRNGPTGQFWKGLKPPKGRHWRTHPDELTKLDEQGLIEWSKTGNPRKRIYADEVLKNGKKRQDIWEFKDFPYPVYPTEKNADMLKVIIQASSNPNDIVLDCFAGSGTTLVCAEELGRRWIGLDNSPWAIEASLKRLTMLRRVSAFTLYNATSEPLPLTLQEILQQKST
ncbi:MAG: site-specific DNA-methyltransferase [Dehalococcoidia bacterium]|nr:site-specific DNA-methyltransferase [Dehalococcoidia bacterium]